MKRYEKYIKIFIFFFKIIKVDKIKEKKITANKLVLFTPALAGSIIPVWDDDSGKKKLDKSIQTLTSTSGYKKKLGDFFFKLNI